MGENDEVIGLASELLWLENGSYVGLTIYYSDQYMQDCE